MEVLVLILQAVYEDTATKSLINDGYFSWNPTTSVLWTEVMYSSNHINNDALE